MWACEPKPRINLPKFRRILPQAMGWLWWSGPKVTAKDRALLNLKLHRDRIKQYQHKVAITQAREHDLARQCLASGNKSRALLFLRREKFQKQLLTRTDEQLATLEQLLTSIEFAQIQRDIAFGLQQGAAALKEINAEMSLDRVEKIMDESEDAIAYQNELSEMLAGRLSRADELDVEEELNRMEAQVTKDKRPAVPADKDSEGISAKFPEVPREIIQTEFGEPEELEEAMTA